MDSYWSEPGDVRALKADIREIIQHHGAETVGDMAEGEITHFPGDDTVKVKKTGGVETLATLTDLASGFSKLLLDEAAAPTTGAGQGGLYTKEVSAKTELFYRTESNGAECQLTSNGSLNYALPTVDPLTLAEQGSAPTTASNQGKLYTKEAAGTTELFYRGESNGTEVQLTSGGAVSGGVPKGLVTGLAWRFNTTSAFYLGGGDVEVNGVKYNLAAETSKSTSGLANSTWYAVTVKAPSSGVALGATEIEYSSTMPTYDHAKAGWYDATGMKRCIALFKTDGSGNIVKAKVSAGKWIHPSNSSLLSGGTSTSRTLVTSDTPGLSYEFKVELYARIVRTGDNASVFLGLYNGAETSQCVQLGAIVQSGNYDKYLDGELTVATDTNRQFGYTASNANSSATLYQKAFGLPQGMAGAGIA